MSTPPAAVDEDLRTVIAVTLRRQLDDRTPAESAHGAEFTRLWRLAAEHAAGGKMIRPLLLIETCRGFRTPSAPDGDGLTLEIAALVEQLHLAFLLHDDVIDNDLQRRGAPNVIGVLSQGDTAASAPRRHWARSSALLLGDLLLASATLGFARADLPADIRHRLLDLLDRTITVTVAGEHGDVALGDGIVSPDLRTILAVTRDKTAVYSFELPLLCGAILGGASTKAESVLAEIGRRLGLAYQLQDDLLSVFGEQAEHGKDPWSDLREAKQTAIIAYARMTSAWTEIAPRLGRDDLRPDEAATIRDQLRGCGAERFVRQLIDEQRASAALLAGRAAEDGVLPTAVFRVVIDLLARLEERRA